MGHTPVPAISGHAVGSAYLYVRFSSSKQEDGDSRERQERVCRDHCVRMGWDIAEEFGDFGVSAWKGDHLSKGKLGKFADRVRSGEIPKNSILVVEDLDRLSRQHPKVTQRWMDEMTDAGLRIAVVSNNKVYDQDSLRDSLFETFEILMKAHAAWDYVQKLAGRVASSWVSRREEASRGIVVSAHCPGWLKAIGERKDPNRRFEPIPKRAQVVRDIYQMAADGMGAPSIAKALSKRGEETWGKDYHHRESDVVGWDQSYVRAILQSAAVEGDYEPGKGRKSYKNKTGERFVGYFGKPVVDADLVARARAAVASRRGKGGLGKGSEQLTNLFVGLVSCASCGGRMRLISNPNKKFSYLVCQVASSGRGCSQKTSFNYTRFERAALDAMLPLALDDRFFNRPDQTNSLAVTLAETKKAIDVKQKAADNLGQAIAADTAGQIPTLVRLSAEVAGDIATLGRQAKELEAALLKARGAVSPAEHMNRVLEVRGALEHPDHATRIAARRKVIEAIKGVVTMVTAHAAYEYMTPIGHVDEPGTMPWAGKKILTMALVGGVHCIAFDNDGNVLANLSGLADTVAGGDEQLRKGLIQGLPNGEAQMAGYLRRRSAG